MFHLHNVDSLVRLLHVESTIILGQVEKQDMEEHGCGNGNEPGSGHLDRKCDRKCFILLPFSFTSFFFFFLLPIFYYFKRQPTKSLLKAEFWPATVVCSVWEASPP